MNVDDIDTYSPGAVVNFQRSDWRAHSCVEHVQLFKVKYSRQKKWHTEPVAQ
jgi:hypothetical protein